MNNLEVRTIIGDAMVWVREAGGVLMRYFRGDNLDVHSKGNASDLVTAADKASEQVIISRIREAYPQHVILSEESGADGRAGEYRWVIDPLDGTMNFSQGLPLFCVSIGIEYRGRKVAGVVYAPNLNELFYAVRGEGAFLNGRPIKVGGKSSLSESVVATGFPVDKDVNPVNNIDNVAVIVPQVRGLRRFGSAALDLCYVASGQFDGYWEMNLHEWDVCAALLILEEAGGVYSHFRSDRNISIVAGNKNIHDAIARRLKL